MKTKKYINLVAGLINEHRIISITISYLLLVLLGAYIFYLRYPFAFDASNFYAEDGSVFMNNLINKGPITGAVTLFNGYLVVGQYLVGILGQVINSIFGHGFITLAKAVSVASYIFWGIVCSLPWLLFRKRIGAVASLILMVILWITPLGGYDYAVIGAIGNLKFAFMFIATLLIIYRNETVLCRKAWQFILVDIFLLLCVLTNIATISLLPFIFWRYRKEIVNMLKSPKFSIDSISAIVLCSICVLYVLFVYVNGIPKLSGYLDAPVIWSALIAVFYRGSTYGLFFPINFLFNNIFAVASIVIAFVCVLASRQRKVLIFMAYAVFMNIIGFVYNRPGVTEFFQSYGGGWPGHFFYAGTMIVVFGFVYAVSDEFKKAKFNLQLYAFISIVLLVILVSPTSGSRVDIYNNGLNRPTLKMEVERVCPAKSDKVLLDIYPSAGWTMTQDSNIVCGKN